MSVVHLEFGRRHQVSPIYEFFDNVVYSFIDERSPSII